MDGVQYCYAQKEHKGSDDPNGNLGLTLHMDGETLSVA